MTTLLVIQHKVQDYDTWRRVYDDFQDEQAEGKVTSETVYRASNDPNNVLVLHSFASTADAEAFVARPDLRDAMADAGVDGDPRIEFFEEA